MEVGGDDQSFREFDLISVDNKLADEVIGGPRYARLLFPCSIVILDTASIMCVAPAAPLHSHLQWGADFRTRVSPDECIDPG